jgi:beta-lactamase class C
VHTVFRVASLSKGFTSVLTGILVEKGLINWDDPVTKYYPDIAFKDSAQTNRIQIRHLLSHTSGLPRHAYTNLIEDGLPLENILSRLKTVDLISREGSLYAYQNAAFALVEKVLERAASDTFNSLLEQKIFLPAGMQNASVQYTDLHENKNIARPHQYSSQAGDYVPVKLSNKYFNAVSAGGISASASDMAQWLLVMLGNRPDIISQQTLDYIFTPVIDINTSRYSRRWRVRKSSYALGWRVLNLNGRPIIYHSGYVNAYRSEIVIDKKNRIGVCILFNAPHRFTGDILPGFFNSIDEFYSDRLKEHEEIRG